MQTAYLSGIRCRISNALVAGAFATAIFVSNSATSALMYDQNITPDVIFGGGNANGGWTVDQNAGSGIELGLRAKVRFDENGVPQNIFNSLGNGTYVHRVGQYMNNGRANWSFEWSINSDFNGSGGPLDGLTYLIEIDNDPTAGTNFLSFDPINSGCADHALGTNATGNGGGTSYSCPAAGYATDITVLNVAQNSWQLNFFTGSPFFHAFDPDTLGEYTFRLTAFSGSTQIAQTEITVEAVPEPGTLAIFGLGLAGLGCVRRRKAAAKTA